MCYFVIYFVQLIIFPFPCQYILMLSKLSANSNWSIFSKMSLKLICANQDRIHGCVRHLVALEQFPFLIFPFMAQTFS